MAYRAVQDNGTSIYGIFLFHMNIVHFAMGTEARTTHLRSALPIFLKHVSQPEELLIPAKVHRPFPAKI